MKKRSLSLILLIALLTSVSCGDQTETQTETTSSGTTDSSEVTTARLEPELPDKRWDGYEFRVLTKGTNNVHWKSKDIAASEENTRLRELLNLQEKHTDYEMESCKVVLWSSSNWSSSFTISKGRSSGIELNDPVVTEYGVVVGQVTELGETWATVSTVMDVDMSIGAYVGTSGASGMSVGEFALMKKKEAKLTFIAEGAQIFVGDEVLTSGSGGAFPAGLLIGTITNLQTEAGGQIEYGIIKPECSFDTLVQVFVIKSFEVVE